MQKPKSASQTTTHFKTFLNQKLQQVPKGAYYGLTSKFEKDKQIMYWLYQYVAFNSVFAGGVANLAGEIHLRTDLFRDKAESVLEYADRSAEIAAHIFFAAMDEYGAPHQEPRTHRRLAQLFLYHSANYLNIPPTTFGDWRRDIDETINGVRKGYRINCSNTDEELLRGIGFHLASELLADQEFNVVHEYLQIHYNELYQYLNQTGHPNAYTWIEVHTHVEAEHAEHAMDAALKAIRYYKLGKDQEWASQQIQAGFLEFEQVQAAFFDNLRGRLTDI